MLFDIYKVRKEYGYTQAYLSKCAGVGTMYFSGYEKKKEIPSKYLYNIWKQLPDFPIPDDFFFYTSVTLKVNMHYHDMTQKQIQEAFNISSQATVSSWLHNKIPLYEYKEAFKKTFDPFIIPFELREEKDKKRFMYITQLETKRTK